MIDCLIDCFFVCLIVCLFPHWLAVGRSVDWFDLIRLIRFDSFFAFSSYALYIRVHFFQHVQEPFCTARFGVHAPAISARASLRSSIRSTRRNEVLSPWEYLPARCGFVELIRVVVCLHFHGFPAERFPETEPHLENVTFVIEKGSF